MTESDAAKAAFSKTAEKGGPLRQVAFLQATWYRDIVEQCQQGFLEEIETQGLPRERVTLFEVPGSYDLPLQAKMVARSGLFSAIVAAGFIVDTGTYRYDFMAEVVVEALMAVQLETGVPIVAAVHMPHSYDGGPEQRRFFQENFRVKGREAALACAGILENLAQIRHLDNRS
jgi:6,7-dimethyl-8-ribityllumazine synthase